LPAELIDGRAVAKKVRAEVAERAKKLIARGIKPGLAVVLVGEDPASVVYTTSKGKAAEEAGMYSLNVRLPADISQSDLLSRVDALNDDPTIHGILVQMPLPKQIDPHTVIRRIDPAKDVDGFHPVNVGKMLIGERDGFIPCTPAGIQLLLKESGVKTPGKNCVVIGRSNIVGKPMATLLMQDNENANCTVTVCHRHTVDLKAHTRSADILIVAAGRPGMVTGDMVKPGAVVIDVGTNRVNDPSTKSGTRLQGDVDFESVREVASKITPVPGGVGPMTIAMLMANTVRAAEMCVRDGAFGA
jgi:methylenetetrahydrofolate dehydrogenase (NADP+) / methenyltetrahydrofolate cyclohydrolase